MRSAVSAACTATIPTSGECRFNIATTQNRSAVTESASRDEILPIATGYTAPLHGRGASGLFLSGIVSIVVAVTGVMGPSVPLISFGLAGLMASGAGLYLYWSTMRKKPAVQVFVDRIEFVRGHRTGTVLFSEISDIRGIQWGGSIYPYTRPSRFLILETKDGEWQFGPEVANCTELQETVMRVLNESRGIATSSVE